MKTDQVHVSKPYEITQDDLHDAYVFCKLRREGIGMAKVLETPHLYAALCNTVIARKKAKQKLSGEPAPYKETYL